ncbi:hypothetical protein QHH11_26810 [Aphanizomenon sp. PH219]|uniref:Uncharacterized protein n=1 Tax=Dolichospermum heterosporum TAC447 TaxID=747523 RepID=A0ABY5M1F7_9CYAN|nr:MULTISPECIES: hypothetical protein [Aphanizomenonaceae]MDK2462682.1 hypothetical protein [Aphanizomenon sp. PH219]UUO16902.1 hypothetical protein NG743_07765 [Dolichospermum heterosporum TAC447]
MRASCPLELYKLNAQQLNSVSLLKEIAGERNTVIANAQAIKTQGKIPWLYRSLYVKQYLL